MYVKTYKHINYTLTDVKTRATELLSICSTCLRSLRARQPPEGEGAGDHNTVLVQEHQSQTPDACAGEEGGGGGVVCALNAHAVVEACLEASHVVADPCLWARVRGQGVCVCVCVYVCVYVCVFLPVLSR